MSFFTSYPPPTPTNTVRTRTYSTEYFKISDDFCLFERNHCFAKQCTEVDAYSRFWIFYWAEISPGQLSIDRHRKKIPLQGKIAGVIPPFSVVSWNVRPGMLLWRGAICTKPLPSYFPREAVVFPWDWQKEKEPSTVEDVLMLMKRPHPHILISMQESHSAIAQIAKAYIDEHYQDDSILVSDISQHIGCSAAVLSKSFTKCFGLSPIQYRKKLRIFDVMINLLFTHNNVTTAALSAGFSDLGFFNRNFKSFALTPPSVFLRKSSG